MKEGSSPTSAAATHHLHHPFRPRFHQLQVKRDPARAITVQVVPSRARAPAIRARVNFRPRFHPLQVKRDPARATTVQVVPSRARAPAIRARVNLARAQARVLTHELSPRLPHRCAPSHFNALGHVARLPHHDLHLVTRGRSTTSTPHWWALSSPLSSLVTTDT